MKLFGAQNRSASPEHERIYALYELWYTVVDFGAAALFVVGSVLFFWEATATAATWMFLVGSVFFGLKPTLRLIRELHYLRLGDYERISSESS